LEDLNFGIVSDFEFRASNFMSWSFLTRITQVTERVNIMGGYPQSASRSPEVRSMRRVTAFVSTARLPKSVIRLRARVSAV